MTRLFALVLAIAASLFSPAAHAGAWARTPGEVFLSFSSNLHSSVEALAEGVEEMSRYDSAYLEVGLGHRLTFGADLGRGEYTREAMAFLRYTITHPDARLQAAVDLGVGRRSVEVLGDSDLARIGLSLGYGFGLTPPDWMPMDLQGGWIALDAVSIQDLTRSETRWKVEATFGLNATDRMRFMLQVAAEEWPGLDISYGVNPSIVYQVFDRTSLELGVRAVLADHVELGLEFGLWHRF